MRSVSGWACALALAAGCSPPTGEVAFCNSVNASARIVLAGMVMPAAANTCSPCTDVPVGDQQQLELVVNNQTVYTGQHYVGEGGIYVYYLLPDGLAVYVPPKSRTLTCAGLHLTSAGPPR